MAQINLKTSFSMTSRTSDVTLKIKTSLSTSHLQSAAYFSMKSEKCEQHDEVTDQLRSEHCAYVTGAIMLAIASLESLINELFLQAVHSNLKIFKRLPSNVPGLLEVLWGKAERFSILEKYQLVLAVSEKDKFEEGETPYQEVASAILLRNALVHYKPEWDDELKIHKKIESRLRSKFTLSPFSGPSQSFFPHRCLSHGCAEFVIMSCVNFVKEFDSRLGLQSGFENIANGVRPH